MINIHTHHEKNQDEGDSMHNDWGFSFIIHNSKYDTKYMIVSQEDKQYEWWALVP